jgi:hypothetical protein
MAEHIWTVLCERHLVDPASTVITLVDVMETFSQEGLEGRIEEAIRLGKKGVLVDQPMQLVSWWFRSDPKDKELHVRFVLKNPSGVELFKKFASVKWQEQVDVPARLFVTLEKFPVTELGLHWFFVEQLKPTKSNPSRWVTATKIPIGVEQPVNATSAPAPPSGPTPPAALESS